MLDYLNALHGFVGMLAWLNFLLLVSVCVLFFDGDRKNISGNQKD